MTSTVEFKVGSYNVTVDGENVGEIRSDESGMLPINSKVGFFCTDTSIGFTAKDLREIADRIDSYD
jgi:hypothetical protein